MDKIVYCTHCKEEHVGKATKDAENVVGFFCPRHNKLIDSQTTIWNGYDLYPDMRKFARENVNLKTIAHLKPEKVEGLSKKMAYLFMQLSAVKERKVNYAFAMYHMQFVITRLRSEVRAKGIGGRDK